MSGFPRASLTASFLVLSIAVPARADFDQIRIQEILTAWDYDFDQIDDTDFQFVELRALDFNQGSTADTILAAFDAKGAYLGDVASIGTDLSVSRDDRVLIGSGAIVTNDSPISLSAPQAGWLFDEDPMSTRKLPDGGNNFGHMYGGFSRGLDFDTPLVDGDETTVLFVNYPTGSVERAIVAGGGIAAEAFGPSGTGSFETGVVNATTVPEPAAPPARVAVLIVLAAIRGRGGR